MHHTPPQVRVDLHVHSSFSDQPYSWFLRTSNAAECYTSPERVYRTATTRGMNLVTLTDHDTISGALELAAEYPNVFLSEEVSARFPEDGCIVHTIALDITEAQHAEIQRLRKDIYELVRYLDEHRIAYYWCHPLSQVNGRLRLAHLERCFLMFRALELRNGTRDRAHEDRLREVIDQLTPARLARFAERHPEVPQLNRDGRYALVGGSDDHGGVAIARAFTSFRGEASGAGVAAALASYATQPEGGNATPEILAHNCYGVAAGYFHRSGQLDPASDAMSASLLTALGRSRARLNGSASAFSRLAIERGGHRDDVQRTLRTAAEAALVGGWRDSVGAMAAALETGRVAEAADAVGELVKAALLELPYLLSHRFFVRDRAGAEQFAASLAQRRSTGAPPRVAILTDTADHVNGVALGLRRLLAAARRYDFDLRVVAPGDDTSVQVDDAGIVRVPSIYRHRLAEYPEIEWAIPHFTSLLGYLADERIDLLQLSTPGPLGIAGLLAARLAGVPVIGQFHTDVPTYALHLTGDPTVAALAAKLVGWFYAGLDRVLVPSSWVATRVESLGVPAHKVSKIPRGVDLELFRPERHVAGWYHRYGAADGDPVILYVGRLSREKTVEALLEAFASLRERHPRVWLAIVGDGPLAGALRDAAPPKVIFTGTLTGRELATAYASADVFAFPSETETFGNAVVEAQASGLPAVVADRGAAGENLLDGITGLRVDARDREAFAAALDQLLASPSLRHRMSRAARAFARRYDLDDAARGTFREYARALGRDDQPGPELAELAS
jgi:glycosyltransferase involved in cell wall biosynthesis/predicted metal-dependent phosphoesterase TrpH